MSEPQDTLPGLWDMAEKTPHSSELEAAVKATIEAIHKENPIPPTKMASCQIAISIARNIAKGNDKGRAVANEAMALEGILESLRPAPVEKTDDSKFSPELRELIAALAAPPRLDTPPPSAGAELE